MKQKTWRGLRYYHSENWLNLKHGIFTRHGGVSSQPWDALNVGGTVGDDLEAVKENHLLMYQALEVNPSRACTTWQIHGGDVVVATGPIPHRKWVAQADSIVTNRADTPLVMRFADCLPILFYDPVVNAIGLAHAGWRGTVAHVGANTVQAMIQAYGSQPENIRAIIGPGISFECFQVGDEVVADLTTAYGELGDMMRRDPVDQTAYVDLWRINQLDLERAGVNHIEVLDICTYQNTDAFFSHRAEKGRTGRFGVVLSL